MVKSVNPQNVPEHENPIPAAAIHRGLLISSAISGKNKKSGRYLRKKSAQVALAFDYLKQIIADAGGSIQDIVKVDLYFSDKNDRDLVNPHWLLMFPSKAAQPARQAHKSELPDGCCLQVVFTAILPSDKM